MTTTSQATSELEAAKARYAAIRARIDSQPAGKPLTVDEELEWQFASEDVLRAMYPEVQAWVFGGYRPAGSFPS